MINITFLFPITCLMTSALLLLVSPLLSFAECSHTNPEASPLPTSPVVLSVVVILTANIQLNFLFFLTHSHSQSFQLNSCGNSALCGSSLSVSPQISLTHASSFFQSFLSKPHLYFHLLLHSLALASPSPPFMYIPYFAPPNLFGTNSIIYQILSLPFFICGIKTSPLLDIQATRVGMSV